MATYYGKLTEFDKSTEDWSSYVERLQLFFEANEITNEGKQKAILLSSCGAVVYKLFKSLTAPTKPSEKSLPDLIQIMKDHQEPKPNPIAERFKFNNRNRKPEETVSQYIAELRRLTEHCQYGISLGDMLHDCFVCGMNHERIQQKLLSEGATLTLERVLVIAQALEAATDQSSIMRTKQPTDEVIHAVKVQSGKQRQTEVCFRCGSRQHHQNICPFKEKECYSCQKKGHISRVCRKRQSKQTNVVEKDLVVDVEDFHESEVFNNP